MVNCFEMVLKLSACNSLFGEISNAEMVILSGPGVTVLNPIPGPAVISKGGRNCHFPFRNLGIKFSLTPLVFNPTNDEPKNGNVVIT